MLKISEAVRSAPTPDGTILLELRAGRMFAINGTGAIIWRYLERGFDREDISAALRSEFATVPSETIDRDLDSFLHALSCIHALSADNSGG